MSRLVQTCVLVLSFGVGCVLSEDTFQGDIQNDAALNPGEDSKSDDTSSQADVTDVSGPDQWGGGQDADPDGGDVAPGVDVSDSMDSADGQIQECGEPAPCLSEGPCFLDGVAQCVNGQWVCDYSVVPGYEPGEETLCDGIDNNCDGNIDEAFGVGISCDGPDGDLCANGVRSCTADGMGWVCGPESITDLLEICDGLDNDCDGDVDEGFGEKNVPCDENNDGCFTGTMQCGDPSGGLVCVGDAPCAQPNPNCLPADKPFDVDTCGCGSGVYCDSLTASGCKQGECQCGFLGSPCAEGYFCDAGGCTEL